MKYLMVVAVVVAGASAGTHYGWNLHAGNIGPSGIVRKDGTFEQFDHDFAHSILSIGPSGIILKDGTALQLDADLNIRRSKRSASPLGLVLPQGNIGLSGIVRKDGTVMQFDADFANNIAHIGETGIIMKNGPPIALDENLQLRTKRSAAGHILPAGTVGYSGIHYKDGTVELFDAEFAHNIAEIGPGGLIMKNGPPIAFDENLRLRTKRSAAGHIIGDSGMLTSWGQAVVFREPFTTILLDGPGGLVLSDGQLIQKPPTK